MLATKTQRSLLAADRFLDEPWVLEVMGTPAPLETDQEKPARGSNRMLSLKPAATFLRTCSLQGHQDRIVGQRSKVLAWLYFAAGR